MAGPSQTPLLFDWANLPAPTSTAAAPITNRPGANLYTQAGNANQGGFLALGSDYGATPKAQVPKVDASGYLTVTSASAVAAGTPLASVTAATGPVVMALAGLVPTPLQLDVFGNLLASSASLPTFSCVAAGVSITSGKSVFALTNAAAGNKVLRLVALYVVNSSTTVSALGNSYNIYAAELRPITGVSATGSAATILPHDSSDTLDANVKAYSGSTVTGDNQGALRRWITSSYGLQVNSSTAEAANGEQQGRFPWVTDFGGATKPITVRPGAGIHVKIASTASVGFLDVTCIFTQASA